jgi:cytochrome P450
MWRAFLSPTVTVSGSSPVPRAASGRGAARPAFAYFPFGGGPRRCIGASFAIAEMQLIVATLAQRYRLTLLPGARVIPVARLTLRPSPPVLAQLHRARA